MQQNLLNLITNITKFFPKNEENEAKKFMLTEENKAFFKQCRKELKQEVIIDYSSRKTMILSDQRFFSKARPANEYCNELGNISGKIIKMQITHC